MLLTAQSIAEYAGVSRQAIVKRPELERFFERNEFCGGRPLKLYRKEVLTLWGLNPDSLLRSNKSADESERKIRSDRDYPRKPAHLSEAERIDLEQRVTTLAKEIYLSQSLRDNLESCVKEAVCQIAMDELEMTQAESLKLARYYYKNRLVRADKYYVGKAVAENWQSLHTARFNKNAHNARLPKNNWDYISLFEDLGLAKCGKGSGMLWAIDATQLDVWVKSDDKPVLRSFFLIFDVLTGFPLAIKMIEGESAEKAIEVIAMAVSMWGVPKLGIILDNGTAFRSSYVQGFIENLYTKEAHDWLATQSWHTKIFGHSKFQKYGLPRRPQFFGKAKLERAFDEINTKFVSKYLPLSANYSTAGRQISYELGTVPTTQQREAQEVSLVMAQLEKFLYNDYIHALRTIPNFSRRAKMDATIANCWEFYGGLELERVAPPTENFPLHVFFSTHRIDRHKTKAQFGSINYQQNYRKYHFVASFLDETLEGRELVVILNPNNENEAFVFLEYSPKYYDKRVPNEDSVAFLGIATEVTINSEAAIDKRFVTRNQRAELDKNIQAKLPKFKPSKMEVKPKAEPTKINILTGSDDYKLEDKTNDDLFDLSNF